MGAPAALLELSLEGCACRLVVREVHLVTEFVRRMLASERRLQLLLGAAATPPALEGSPVRLALGGLITGGAAALPRERVVEILARP